jgi:hypothetical protein
MITLSNARQARAFFLRRGASRETVSRLHSLHGRGEEAIQFGLIPGPNPHMPHVAEVRACVFECRVWRITLEKRFELPP